MLKPKNHGVNTHPLSKMFNRHYWLQIGLIALSIIIGIACSAWVIKGSLLKTALEQEMEHYWLRVDRNPNADLPDTKNLYGYRWNTAMPPAAFKGQRLEQGVHRIFVDGKERMTVYGERNGQHVLLVFGESNVNKIVWMFGLAPLMFSLIVLYSILWWSNRRAKRYFSPITRLANALEHIDWAHQNKEASPFQGISTNGNLEAEYLKQALEKYHQVLTESQSKGMEILVQYDPQEFPRMIYPSMTKMVLSNILRNALNYSQGSNIHIIQRKNSIVIADNGIGITMPNDSKVQELNTTQLQLKAKGHGIGLQLVQKLCNQLGWRVELFDRQYYLSTRKYLKLENTTGLIVVVYMN